MKLTFCLLWGKSGQTLQRIFKSKNAYALFADYEKRIGRFASCRTKISAAAPSRHSSGTKVWLCERKGKALSSEGLASQLKSLQNSGVRELLIVVGGPDGIAEKKRADWGPQLLWSFGPMTLPHELAAVLAGEQIYRAFSILNHLPYHTGH